MKLLRYILVFAAAGALALYAQQHKRQPVFISPAQIDMIPLLADPAAPGSAQAASELAELHHFQETRTAQQVARAKSDDAEEDMFIYRDVVGQGFTRDALPLTAALSDHLHNDEGFIVNPAKEFFHRPRPYQADKSIQPVCKVSSNPSDYAYPSGHATTGYLEGLTLSMMVPEKREVILARADDYARNRLICGVHYPTDVAASKQVALAMIGSLLSNPKFQEEFSAAKTETRAKLGF